jgi:chromosome segregation ATPase
MDPRDKLIRELQAKIQKNEELLEQKLKELGRELAALPAESCAGTPLADSYQRCQELNNETSTHRRMIEEIQSTSARIAELENLHKEFGRKISSIHKDVESHFEEVGAAAFAAYKNKPLSQYEELFADLMKIDEEIMRIEKELEHLSSESRERGFFGRVKDKGKAVYLKGSLKAKLMGRAKAYRTVGKAVCNSNLAAELQDPELSRVMAPVEASKDLASQLQQRSEEIAREKEQLSKRLEELGVQDGVSKRIKELQRKISHMQMALSEIHATLGRTYQEHNLSSQISSPQIETLSQGIENLHQENDQHRNRIKRLEAAIEADQVEQSINQANQQIARLEGEIAQRQQEIDRLRELVRQCEQHRQSLLQQRGPLESLFPERQEAPKH